MLCNICPRECNVDRQTTFGFCNSGKGKVSIAKYMLHKFEEPVISRSSGSGAIFFGGCNLRCCYCQNHQIIGAGKQGEISTEELCEIMLVLQDMGAHNINLVTSAHYILEVIEALNKVKHRLNIPIVYNSSGYEKAEYIAKLDGLIDVYLPDFKYYSPTLSNKYSCSLDYPIVAMAAIDEMVRQCGKINIEDNLIKKGVIIRHLILPSNAYDSIEILRVIKKRYDDKILVSIMRQYTPEFNNSNHKELKRKLTTYEYNKVIDEAIKLGLKGFAQDKGCADISYTPKF